MKPDEFDVVDCHVHLTRSEREGWQARAIEDRWDAGGSLEQLLRYMDEAGVSAGWIINAWPTQAMRQALERRIPDDVSTAEKHEAIERVRDELRARCARKNDWLCDVASQYPGRFAAFVGGVDPYFGTDWILGELNRCAKRGAKGVKIISTWGAYYPSDPALRDAFELIQELGLTILAHAGGLDSHAEISRADYALPTQWRPVLKRSKRLKIVMAHLGFLQSLRGYGTSTHQERIEMAREFDNVYFDISVSFEEGYDALLEQVIRDVGVDRCVWASDWHAHRAVLALEGLKASAFSDAEKRMLLGANARQLVTI